MKRRINHREHRGHRALLVSVFSVCSVVSSFAQGWHSGEGVVVLAHITPEQARAAALSIARGKALESAGVEVQALTARHLRESSGGEIYDHFARFTRTVTRGRIVEEDITFGDQVKMGEVWHYKVALRARVQMDVGKPDPTFRVELRLGRDSYRDGETMTMTITASKDCYLTLFNLYSNDSLRVVLPNEYHQANRLSEGETIAVPPPGAGWELPVELPPDRDEVSEAMLAVATRDELPFPTSMAQVGGGLLSFGDALIWINRWLADIPADRRAEAIEHYIVTK